MVNSSALLTPITKVINAQLVEVKDLPGQIPVARHVTNLTADTLVIVLSSAGAAWVVGALGVAPAQDIPPEAVATAPSAPVESPTSTPYRPKFSGTWRGSWRPDTSDLYQGDWTGRGINRGAAWWGPLPGSMTEASLRLVRSAGAGPSAATSPTLVLLAGTTRPAGWPQVLDTQTGPSLRRGETADWVLPETWVAQMRVGTAGGIGISINTTSPYMALVVSDAGMTLTVTHTT